MAADAALLTTSNESGGASNMFGQLGQKLMLVAGIAAVVAVMVVFWLWSQKPDYRVLFSNFADKDGGAIVAELDKLNIPYQFADGGGAILVPADMVHQARLKLAAQGLPKGGNIGFELLENQKFGVSQFVEQVNFQRGLEGELERSIQSISAVQAARIHLAIPKPSVFVREQQYPTASVLLNLHNGRRLDAQQVGAVVHLVASSVPNLSADHVTVVDQNGNLLSDNANKLKQSGLDPEQMAYVENMQNSIARRVESIITPIVGAKNVHAETSAEIDFSMTEQANESYKPNTKPDDMAIRSAQSHETQNTGANNGAVPGALSNQPPADATAPINAPGAQGQGENAAPAAAPTPPQNTQKDTTTNYELDKTVSYIQQAKGGIKRLHVAVVVNHIPVVDSTGKTTYRALTAAEKQQVSDLAMQAMGYNKERGDTISVVNTPFVAEAQEKLVEPPLWKDPVMIEYGKDALRFLAGVVVLMMIYKKLLKPMATKLTGADKKQLAVTAAQNAAAGGEAVAGAAGSAAEGEDALVTLSGDPPALTGDDGRMDQTLLAVKQVAKENPRMVANVVSSWATAEK
ncbi:MULTISPECIES: flagellar basal-body MS-ring/collar protein FliF [unclassified Methylophilus]|jgi:flagellar M-ring protein FliF|uniref:Flagellar M-ring protein n=1 Tax=Methylophilus glucosoxydans TaxID=752553 RepID=A0ABW3GNS0_9PROT|nr:MULTISPECIES: flagellar basal-body MS-ring/collar protein FliF [unclassified Methylophilus]MBF5038155.1 flagellar M-ring protein FliF [Methylophilus sp. 13]MDF0376655.1 flagellar basal body M-ring protein FliF [Methylophilus sp. YYY-1]MDT7850553.1 flagellar basal-body MS-ring/collar protein FliF [Methylophilus sp. VKM B-3414]